MKVVVGLAVMLLACAVGAGEGRALFNGRDLSGWYTYLNGRGRNVDPQGVFSVTNGVIHVTGREFGALVSEEEFSNYRLSLEYRFLGGEQFGGKRKAAPDSGLLFHSTGPDGAFGGVWMESIEVNLIKGATGDFWGVGTKGSDRIALSGRVGAEKLGRYFIHDPQGTNVFTITGNTRICRSDIARDWKDAITVREADNEKPLGEWNRVELVCSGGDVTVTFNGRTVNRGFNAKPTRGRLQLQSEGCPIEFRNIVISPLGSSERVLPITTARSATLRRSSRMRPSTSPLGTGPNQERRFRRETIPHRNLHIAGGTVLIGFPATTVFGIIRT